jgi:uncharacterized glyoxalase superfamily protein PhnB
MNWRLLLVALTLVPFLSLQAQQPPPAPPTNQWKDFDFLVGEWTWVGGGRPGQGKGLSTLRPELGGTVLVRKTHLDYPATKERAAFGHDDLIYVYHDPQDNSVHAIFFDGEGHVIRYAVTVASDGNSTEFLSDAARLNLRRVERPVIESRVRDREELLSASMTVATAEEIKLLFLEFQSAGAAFYQKLKKQPWGARNFVVKDPDGNLLLFAGPAN